MRVYLLSETPIQYNTAAAKEKVGEQDLTSLCHIDNISLFHEKVSIDRDSSAACPRRPLPLTYVQASICLGEDWDFPVGFCVHATCAQRKLVTFLPI